MQRKFGQGAAALACVVLLGGCSSWGPAFTTAADTGPDPSVLATWGGTRPPMPVDTYTIRRVRGAEAEPVENRLELEPGNVWPAEEAPRATLANPDAALRGVQPWRPGEPRSGRDLPVDERPGGPLVPRADGAPVEEQGPRAQRRRRGASSPPPPPLVQPEPERVEVLPVPPGAYDPPQRRYDGQVLLTPGGPVVTGPGTGRVQSFTTPGGGSGTIHRDGGFTTITPSGGIPQTFPTPR